MLTLVPKKPHHKMVFTPGQYAAIGFREGVRPTPMRCFSITSTPDSGVLQFGMRVRGDFTRAATRLKPGDPVRVQGPFGDFTLDLTYDKRIVMLASGIGITPFIGKLRYLAEKQLPLPVTLLVSNRSATDIPFYEELLSLARQNPYLRLYFFCGNANRSVPNMVQGTITDLHIRHLCSGSNRGSTYFICGSKNFSKRMQTALRQNLVHETRIVKESFTQISSVKIGESGWSVRSLTYGTTAVSLLLMSGFIMTLDLGRVVPRLMHNQAAASSVQQTNGASSVGSQSSGSSNTNVSPNTGLQTTPAPTNYYQPPVSTVS